MSDTAPRRPLRAAVVTLSDKASAGLRADASGPALKNLLTSAGFEVGEPMVIPDEQAVIEETLSRMATLACRPDLDNRRTGLAHDRIRSHAGGG